MTQTTDIAAAASDRNATIAALRKVLRDRTGHAWSVTGGKGTAWGWITVTSVPARRTEFGSMTDADREELSTVIGDAVHHQGWMIPASSDHRAQALEMAHGLAARSVSAYWD